MRLVRSSSGTAAPVTRPAVAAAAVACSSSARGEMPCSSAACSRASNSGVTCRIVPSRWAILIGSWQPATVKIKPTTWQGRFADGGLPYADGAGLLQHCFSKISYLIGPAQNGKSMCWSTFLHHDRNQPGVGGSSVDQAAKHPRPDSRIQIVDICLDEHSRVREVLVGPRVSFTDEYPGQVGRPGVSRLPAPAPDACKVISGNPRSAQPVLRAGPFRSGC